MRARRRREDEHSDAGRGERAFIEQIGVGVRRLRQQRRLSRRELGERSGVSQRYLAQLEGGLGNSSIGLLYRVADALGCTVADLVSSATPSGAPPHRRLCLIGLRGAGKSTLGRLLGEALHVPFVELNEAIERDSGMAVEEVMALYGLDGYRRLERQALEQIVASADGGILAVAGGIVSDAQSYAFLLKHFHTIWLKAAPLDHMRRVRAQGDERPMAGNPRAMEELNAILAAREELYAQAERTVDTSGKTIETVLQELIGLTAGLEHMG